MHNVKTNYLSNTQIYVKSFLFFFSVTFVLMRDIKTHAADIIDWFIEKGVYLPSIRNTPISSNGTLSDSTSYRDDLIRVRPQHTL